MNRQQAEALASELAAEAAANDDPFAYAIVEAHNAPRNVPPQAIVWAVLQTNTDDDCGTDTIWVTPDLSFPARA